jgi:hypothetical protein
MVAIGMPVMEVLENALENCKESFPKTPVTFYPDKYYLCFVFSSSCLFYTDRLGCVFVCVCVRERERERENIG